jgi:hypothetical protein
MLGFLRKLTFSGDWVFPVPTLKWRIEMIIFEELKKVIWKIIRKGGRRK